MIDAAELAAIRKAASEAAKPYGCTAHVQVVETDRGGAQPSGIRVQLTVVRQTASGPLQHDADFRADRKDLQAVIARNIKDIAAGFGRV